MKALYPKVKRIPSAQVYFPDYEDGQLPDREYFIKVVATIMPGWLEKQVEHARAQRYEQVNPEKVYHALEMAQDRLDELESSKMVASKCSHFSDLLEQFKTLFCVVVEGRGTFVNMMQMGAVRKRFKKPAKTFAIKADPVESDV